MKVSLVSCHLYCIHLISVVKRKGGGWITCRERESNSQSLFFILFVSSFPFSVLFVYNIRLGDEQSVNFNNLKLCLLCYVACHPQLE